VRTGRKKRGGRAELSLLASAQRWKRCPAMKKTQRISQRVRSKSAGSVQGIGGAPCRRARTARFRVYRDAVKRNFVVVIEGQGETALSDVILPASSPPARRDVSCDSAGVGLRPSSRARVRNQFDARGEGA